MIRHELAHRALQQYDAAVAAVKEAAAANAISADAVATSVAALRNALREDATAPEGLTWDKVFNPKGVHSFRNVAEAAQGWGYEWFMWNGRILPSSEILLQYIEIEEAPAAKDVMK